MRLRSYPLSLQSSSGIKQALHHVPSFGFDMSYGHGKHDDHRETKPDAHLAHAADKIPFESVDYLQAAVKPFYCCSILIFSFPFVKGSYLLNAFTKTSNILYISLDNLNPFFKN
ncbi:hypothetical protein JW979_10055 [bacterium]|nr:hypothetical protein [candidate division CSSED10-310 bacterium]